jgi:alpha-L-fucosidase
MLFVSLTALLALAQQSTEDQAEQTQGQIWASDRDERMAWWRDARFGMFVHWGLYSGAGGSWNGKVYPQHYAEWIQNWASVPCGEYAKAMKPLFKPAEGFADAWAELAQDAGMRYAVMTAKHHEGFTLFTSKQPYSLANDVTGGTNISPAGRDVAREFADAMRARGLRAGFYYSLLDWQHPDAYPMALPGYPKSGHARDPSIYIAYVRAHVSELLRDYGSLSTIWFDYSDQKHQGEAWGAANLLSDMRSLQPGVLVNNRLYNGLENKRGDYGTPEKYVPPTGLPGMDWEVNHTLNESYGYSQHDDHWKDTKSVVRLLCDIVSKGGNLLLNIGPDANGRVPEEAAKTLRGVGSWMRIHSKAIYGTTASPFERLAWGRATQKPGFLYLMVFDWPADGVLKVPLNNNAIRARLLDDKRKVDISRNPKTNAIELALPGAVPDASCSVIELAIEGPPDVQPFAVVADASGQLVLSPHDAKISPPLRIEQVGVTGDVQYNLGYWSSLDASAEWPVLLLRRSKEQGPMHRYEVRVVLACRNEDAGSTYAVEVAGRMLEGVVPGTGGWQSYEERTLGELSLPDGRHSLAIKARSISGGALLNLRSIRLVPVNKIK